jgi:hypothetical protein
MKRHENLNNRYRKEKREENMVICSYDDGSNNLTEEDIKVIVEAIREAIREVLKDDKEGHVQVDKQEIRSDGYIDEYLRRKEIEKKAYQNFLIWKMKMDEEAEIRRIMYNLDGEGVPVSLTAEVIMADGSSIDIGGIRFDVRRRYYLGL